MTNDNPVHHDNSHVLWILHQEIGELRREIAAEREKHHAFMDKMVHRLESIDSRIADLDPESVQYMKHTVTWMRLTWRMLWIVGSIGGGLTVVYKLWQMWTPK